mmetsp:Transcript_12466/g.36196  ORF Transcript_12466/g.36196 Transcript_12466/m.36196 type:complete len:325 (-) Transcript_12466:339-1313(-)
MRPPCHRPPPLWLRTCCTTPPSLVPPYCTARIAASLTFLPSTGTPLLLPSSTARHSTSSRCSTGRDSLSRSMDRRSLDPRETRRPHGHVDGGMGVGEGAGDGEGRNPSRWRSGEKGVGGEEDGEAGAGDGRLRGAVGGQSDVSSFLMTNAPAPSPSCPIIEASTWLSSSSSNASSSPLSWSSMNISPSSSPSSNMTGCPPSLPAPVALHAPLPLLLRDIRPTDMRLAEDCLRTAGCEAIHRSPKPSSGRGDGSISDVGLTPSTGLGQSRDVVLLWYPRGGVPSGPNTPWPYPPLPCRLVGVCGAEPLECGVCGLGGSPSPRPGE